MAPHRARRVLSRNVAWVIPFGIVGIRHDRLDGPMDEIPPRARGGARDAHPATSRDARPREDATGTRVSGGRRSSLGNFTRRDDEVASAEEDERGGRASIDRFVPHRDCVGIDSSVWIREGFVTSGDSSRGDRATSRHVRHSTRRARGQGGEGDATNGDGDEESRARVGGIL